MKYKFICFSLAFCISFLYADSIVFLPNPKQDVNKQKKEEVENNSNEVNLNLFDIQERNVAPKELKGFEIIEGDELPQEDNHSSLYTKEEIILAQNTYNTKKTIEEKNQSQIKVANGATFIAVSMEKDPKKISINNKFFPWIPHPLDSSKKIAIISIDYRAKLGNMKLNDKYMIDIVQGNYKREKITLKDSSKAKPNKQASERIAKELNEANKIYRTFTKKRYWSLPFQLPIDSIITSPFGSARIFNNEIKSFHGGTDFRAKIGTPIHAINDGIVVIAKERFLAGKSVVLDHGEGIYSMYYHCSDIKVKVGQKVSRGQVVALSGDTGRVSAAHLHFGMLVNGIQVDPINFIETINNLSK